MNDDRRNIADINGTLSKAKLLETDIKSASQVIYIGDADILENNFRLLELDKHLVQSLNEGDLIRIVGDSDEKAVLCTNSKTYDVLNTETTNSLLLIQDLQFDKDITNDAARSASDRCISAIFHDYLEVVPCKLKIQKLQDILNKSIYSGPELEYEIDPADLKTLPELKACIQGSETELMAILKKIKVVTIDNKVRKLDFEYHFRVLSYMLKLIDENSWGPDEIDYCTTVDSLENLIPREVIEGLWDVYTEESCESEGNMLYRYKETEVCQFFARVILHSSSKFNLTDFLGAWAQSVPEGMVTDESMLHGIANIDRSKTPHTISLLTEEMLPYNNLPLKLKTLFTIKEKWTVPEISPYIETDTTDKLNVNALLTKHARASKMNGVQFYSAKHGK